MKVTNRLTHIATKVDFEAAMTEDQLKAVFEAKGVAGFPAMLDIKERTEELLGFWLSMTCWSLLRLPVLPLPRMTSRISRMRIKVKLSVSSSSSVTIWKSVLTLSGMCAQTRFRSTWILTPSVPWTFLSTAS